MSAYEWAVDILADMVEAGEIDMEAFVREEREARELLRGAPEWIIL